MLEHFFDMEDTGVCLTSEDHKIIYQNEFCKSMCGDHQNSHCDQCLKVSGTVFDGDVNSTVEQQKKFISNTYCDVYKLKKNNSQELTLFRPIQLNDSYKAAFKKAKLTKRETQIASLVVAQASNGFIQHKLFITKSTLKTHLNQIYKKLPELKSIRSEKINDVSVPSVPMPSL